MRKNRMMRLASALLILTMVTTCAISGTFAKYVTTDSATDTARVAKWGVTANVTGGAFATSYATNENPARIDTTVVSSTEDKLVAPGTAGTFTGVALTGIPEVAVNITKVATLTLGGWTIDHDKDAATDDKFYCPIVITVNDTPYSGLNYGKADDFIAAVESAIENANGDYDAKTNLANITSMNGDYTWAWAFKGAAGGYSAAQIDTFDTMLGDLEAAGTSNSITLAVGVTVTQID